MKINQISSMMTIFALGAMQKFKFPRYHMDSGDFDMTKIEYARKKNRSNKRKRKSHRR